MHGGIKVYRGSAAAARNYLDADRSRADDYYLAEGTGVARRFTAGPDGPVVELTSLTGGRLFEVEKTEKLDTIFLSILQEFRQRYLVSYTPRGVTKEGWHKLDVRVKRGGTVKARPGYQS